MSSQLTRETTFPSPSPSKSVVSTALPVTVWKTDPRIPKVSLRDLALRDVEARPFVLYGSRLVQLPLVDVARVFVIVALSVTRKSVPLATVLIDAAAAPDIAQAMASAINTPSDRKGDCFAGRQS